MKFSPIRGCFSQMFVLQKKILFARGLNWDQSCLWKTPPSHFLLFSPLACPYFFIFFSSPDFWGVKEAPCKNLYVFGENLQRNQFPKLTTLLLLFHSCNNIPIVQWMAKFSHPFWEGPSLTNERSPNLGPYQMHLVECAKLWFFDIPFPSIIASLGRHVQILKGVQQIM